MKRLLTGTMLAVLLLAGPAPAAEFSFDIKPAPQGLTQANFKLWLPDGLKEADVVRGLVGVSNHEAGARLYTDEAWRAFAVKNKCGILMYELRQPQPPEAKAKKNASPRGQTIGNAPAGEAIKKALEELARQAKRPELRHACLIPTGLSRGGYQASALAQVMPERIIGFIAIHGASDGSQSEAARQVPGLATIGARDNLVSDRPFGGIMNGRQQGALWAAAIEPGVPHAQNGDQALPILWAQTILDLRLPRDIAADQPVQLNRIDPSAGWLGELEYTKAGDGGAMTIAKARVAAFKDYAGDKAKAQWLPSEAVARKWVEFHKVAGN